MSADDYFPQLVFVLSPSDREGTYFHLPLAYMASYNLFGVLRQTQCSDNVFTGIWE